MRYQDIIEISDNSISSDIIYDKKNDIYIYEMGHTYTPICFKILDCRECKYGNNTAAECRKIISDYISSRMQ
jgi:hypothetical protein